jgi:hypothetical protein
MMMRNGEENFGQATTDGHGVCGDGREGAPEGSHKGAEEGNRQQGGAGPLEEGYVYFIETEGGEYVKIGYSKRLYRRISQLGTLRPGNFALRIIGVMPGTVQTERWLHSKFSDTRENGEWFRNTPTLRAFIQALGLITIEEPQKRATRRPRGYILPKPRRRITKPVRNGSEIIPAELPQSTESIPDHTPDDTAADLGRVLVDVVAAGKKGGESRRDNMTADERKRASQEAIRARWDRYYEQNPEKLKAKQGKAKKAKTAKKAK